MQDDIIAALTQEVKEEVIENYVYERRLIDEQMNHVNELAEHTIELEGRLYRRFARIYEYLSEPKFISLFAPSIGMKEVLFESRFRKDPYFRKGLRFIRVRGLTNRARFKKLLYESYRRLFAWNKAYREAYENLQDETKAVNQNLKKFEGKFDLLTILSFLKDMDVEFVQKQHFLGDNFTPEEMAAVEATLHLRPIRMEQFKLVPPPDLPHPHHVERQLSYLADTVYDQCAGRIDRLMQ